MVPNTLDQSPKCPIDRVYPITSAPNAPSTSTVPGDSKKMAIGHSDCLGTATNSSRPQRTNSPRRWEVVAGPMDRRSDVKETTPSSGRGGRKTEDVGQRLLCAPWQLCGEPGEDISERSRHRPSSPGSVRSWPRPRGRCAGEWNKKGSAGEGSARVFCSEKIRVWGFSF